jgi:putative ubiquitin-RnfH superfamily antitoxin RatB of RatAB toxin-antitoxin module
MQIEVLDIAKQHIIKHATVAGTTIGQLAKQFAWPASAIIGVFGRRVSEAYVVAAGDRVELYQPLVVDAMSARRQRARTQARQRGENRGESGVI